MIRRTNRVWKHVFLVVSSFFMLSTLGCGDDTYPMQVQPIEEEYEQELSLQNNQEMEEQIIGTCFDLYEKAAEEKTLADLDVIQRIVSRFGENGFPAIDSKNQVNMTCAEQVIRFCGKVDAKKEDKLTIIEVTNLGGFIQYDFHTKDGNVDVVRNAYEYENKEIRKEATARYQTQDWKYTEDGYLMFSGVWFSEELYALTLSGVEEHVAFRVEPLEEECRELNRRYLLPISYEQNNMFIINWSEDDIGELNFYDLYDIFYSEIYHQYPPYPADDNLGVGAIYKIPKDEFERVIQTYIKINSKTLQVKTRFHPEDETYEYKPRGFYEIEYPEYPYSEVVKFTKHSDGTITLLVHVVYPFMGVSKVYAHEVVVRPLEDGGVEYVSNHIIPSEDNYEETWHTSRLTEKEWDEMYGG